MSEIEGIYAVWLREAKIYIREKERLVSAVISPLLWIFGFGAGVGTTVESVSGYPYQMFIYPGIMVMTVLFTSLFYGIYIIWDRKLDFLKEVLVAPVSRASVFTGKMLGGATDAMVQVIYLIIIGFFFLNVPFTPLIMIEAFLMLLLISIAMVSIGLVIGANLTSPEGFSLVINFVMWPMFFFSGALFPVSNLSPWLAVITKINPMTYGVDAMRGIILGGINHYSLLLDTAVLMVFTSMMIGIGIMSFRRM